MLGRKLFLLGSLAFVCSCGLGVAPKNEGAAPFTPDPELEPSQTGEWADSGPTSAQEQPACASVEVGVDVEFLKRPADIVWVVDTSPSMENEAALIQKRINGFARRFEENNVDAQIVMITDPTFVSVPSPLRDDKDRFFMVGRSIDSTAAMVALIDEWPKYEARLREKSIVHFVTVTDDESRLTADCFVSQMTELVGPDRRFKLHTISSEDTSIQQVEPHEEPSIATCDNRENREKTSPLAACEGAAQPGRQYRRAAHATGGQAISICTSDWTTVFDQLAESVEEVTVHGCNFALPAPPEGKFLQPNDVTLLAESGGERRPLVRVREQSKCSAGDWYYDNTETPREVLLCPQSCDQLSAQGAQLTLELACGWTIR